MRRAQWRRQRFCNGGVRSAHVGAASIGEQDHFPTRLHFQMHRNALNPVGVHQISQLQREEEFNFVDVPFYPLNSEGGGDDPVGRGYMCTRATDEEVLDKRGHRAKYTEALQEAYGFTSIWDRWNATSGLLPTPVYLSLIHI